jgi:hypothetical protein
VLRASAAAESAGIPSVSLTCEGFIGQAKATSSGLGYRGGMPIAMAPGHSGVWSAQELQQHTAEVVLPGVIAALTQAAQEGETALEPRAKDIVFRGSFSEVNEYFLAQEWSDGLPVVPPTQERVDAFLACTKLHADEVIGVMLPDKRAATVHNVAGTGVMAGCRPEYMPILVALAGAMADPAYGVEHSGNTPGAETLIVLNGPIVKELGFNYTQGVMRDGFQPNTSIGRFWRLYLRNVAGFLPHKTDKGSFGNTWRVVVPENEDVLAKIGWQPLCADMGLAPGTNAVTISRYTGGNVIASVSGSTPEEILPFIADAMKRIVSWQLMFTTSTGRGSLRPMLLLTPVLAETIARAGWKKRQVQQYLFDHARISASDFERLMQWTGRKDWNLTADVRDGKIPAMYAESDDPERMVPLVWAPEDYAVAVTGDPLRTNAYVFAHNGRLGFPVSRAIVT